MTFIQRFQSALESLPSLPENSDYVVAYSGGVDSHVLLYCCHQLKLPLRALHVHHGLQSVADDWVLHCQSVCDDLNIPLSVLYVDAGARPGQSPEEAARDARYQALKDNLLAGDYLLTAQHRDDQAETLLLQLFRGSGSAGLAAMPAARSFGDSLHLRPLLPFSREEIEDFARRHALRWIEDPSNRDVSFDRNFVRKYILGELHKRWPQISTQLSTAAALQFSNLQVLEDMAAIDLAHIIETPPAQLSAVFSDVLSVLSITRLQQLSNARLFNVLRYWLLTQTQQSATRKLLEETERALIYSQPDATPLIDFAGFHLRRYQDGLYLLRPDPGPVFTDEIKWQPSTEQTVTVLPLNIELRMIDTEAAGLQPSLRNEVLTLRCRRGGERFQPCGRQHSQSLKKLLQQAGIPPWERDRIPLVFFGDELVAVPGLGVSQKQAVKGSEGGWGIEVKSL